MVDFNHAELATLQYSGTNITKNTVKITDQNIGVISRNLGNLLKFNVDFSSKITQKTTSSTSSYWKWRNETRRKMLKVSFQVNKFYLYIFTIYLVIFNCYCIIQQQNTVFVI